MSGRRVVHAVSTAGWAIFGVVGAALMFLVAVLYAFSPGEHADNGFVGNLFGGAIVFMPIGAVLGGLVGFGAQRAARAWLRSAPPVESSTARGKRLAAERSAAAGLDPSSEWSRRYQKCLRSVTAYHELVRGLDGGAAKDWLADVGATLDAELDEALQLAKVGESLDHGEPGELSPTAKRAGEQLDDAVRSFADTADRAAAIALDLRDDSDFAKVRAQLDVLAEQTPHLRTDHGR